MVKLIFWLIVGALVLTQTKCANNSPSPQQDCGFVMNSDTQRVSWKSQRPIRMYFDSSVPNQYYDSIKSAFQTWANGIGYSVFYFVGALNAGPPSQDGKSVVYWMTTWDASSTYQQANTTIYWVGNQIVEADVRINAQNFLLSSDPAVSQVDVESLALHELGHVLGLRHDDSVPSVMAKSLPMGAKRRSLYAADLANIKCEY